MAIKRIGQGKDIVFLHGWGMNRAVFEPLAESIQDTFCCHLVDLPGFGERAYLDLAVAEIDDWLDAILDELPKQAHWLGWSLGGLMVQRVAQRFPHRVASQLLMASSPFFKACKETKWRGIQPQVLTQFSDQLSQDAKATIERFLAIQAMGSDTVRQDVKALKLRLFSLPEANPKALLDGLALLEKVDYRNQPAEVAAHWLLGKQDALVPIALAGWLAQNRPKDSVTIIEQASHAPFISHPQQTLRWLLEKTE